MKPADILLNIALLFPLGLWAQGGDDCAGLLAAGKKHYLPNPDSAILFFGEALSCYQSTQDGRGMALSYQALSSISFWIYEYEKSLIYADSGFAVCDSVNCPPSTLAMIGLTKGDSYYELEQYSQALSQFDEAIVAANSADVPPKFLIQIYSLAGMAAHKLRHYYQAVEYFTEGIQASLINDLDHKRQMDCLVGIMDVYETVGEYDRCLEIFYHDYLPNVQEESGEFNEDVLVMVASAYEAQHMPDSASYYHQRFAKEVIQSSDREYSGFGHFYLGNLLHQSHPDSAKYHLSLAIEIGQGFHYGNWWVNESITLLGTIAYQQGDFELAKQLLWENHVKLAPYLKEDIEQKQWLKTAASHFKLGYKYYQTTALVDSALWYLEQAHYWDKAKEKNHEEEEYFKQQAMDQFLEASAQARRARMASQRYQGKVLWLGSLASILILAALILILRFRQLRVGKEQEISLLYAELRVLRLQFNPHFLFNALASIQQFVLKADTKRANHFLLRFAKLMRLMLNASDKLIIPLKEELDTLKNYLEIEQLRMSERFVYRFNIEDNLPLDEIQVPSMFLQIFAENALWHGISPKPEGGELVVSAHMRDRGVQISILDDGIGREAAAKRKTGNLHKSKGMKMVKDKISLFNQERQYPMSLAVHDCKDETGKATGTLVEIWIPFK